MNAFLQKTSFRKVALRTASPQCLVEESKKRLCPGKKQKIEETEEIQTQHDEGGSRLHGNSRLTINDYAGKLSMNLIWKFRRTFLYALGLSVSASRPFIRL